MATGSGHGKGSMKTRFQKGREVTEKEREKVSKQMQGNINALKLKDEEVLVTAYNALCQWISTGRAKRGFVFNYEKEDGSKAFVTWQAIERTAEKFPSVCDPSLMQACENLGYQAWETTGIQMLKGEIPSNPVIFQIFMRNLYSWDKETRVSHTHETDARKFMKYCEESSNADRAQDSSSST